MHACLQNLIAAANAATAKNGNSSNIQKRVQFLFCQANLIPTQTIKFYIEYSF